MPAPLPQAPSASPRGHELTQPRLTDNVAGADRGLAFAQPLQGRRIGEHIERLLERLEVSRVDQHSGRSAVSGDGHPLMGRLDPSDNRGHLATNLAQGYGLHDKQRTESRATARPADLVEDPHTARQVSRHDLDPSGLQPKDKSASTRPLSSAPHRVDTHRRPRGRRPRSGSAPTIRRLNASMTKLKNTTPSQQRRYVKSASPSASGRSAVKSRSTRSGLRAAVGSRVVVAKTCLAAWRPECRGRVSGA